MRGGPPGVARSLAAAADLALISQRARSLTASPEGGSHSTKKQAARPGSLSQSLFFDHHIRGLVQIAAAHADDEVALFGVLPDPGGGTLEAVHHDTAGQLGGQILAPDTAVVLLAAAHDGQQHDLIGGTQHLGEVVHQHLGAAVGERLMYSNDAVIAHLLGRRQRGGQLGGMVGVVIDDDRAVALALDLKAAARAVELLGCANGVLGLEAQRAHAAAHGQRIVNVVVAGHTPA